MSGADWTRYRGPNRTGFLTRRSSSGGVRSRKKPGLENENSQRKLLAYLTGEEVDDRIPNGIRRVVGQADLAESDAKVRADIVNAMNGSATPSPATDDRTVIVFFPELWQLAFDTDGKEFWRVPLGSFGVIQVWPYAGVRRRQCHPPDIPEQTFVAAYDAKSGKQFWKADRPIGFFRMVSATPSLHEHNGRMEVIVAGAVELTSYDVKRGRKISWARGVTYGPAALPLVAADSV